MQLLLVTLKVTKVNMHTFIEVIEPAKAHYCANSHQNPILTSRFLSYVQFSYQKQLSKSMVKVRCCQNLVTSGIRNSCQVTSVSCQ